MDLSAQCEGACELQRNQQLLHESALFGGVGGNLLKVLAYLCERRIFSPGQNLFTQGEPAEASVILVAGTARIEHAGRRIATLGAGHCAGGLALFGTFRWLYSLQAIDKVEGLFLPRHKILPQLIAQPASLALVVGELVSSVVTWDRQLLERSGEVCCEGLGML